MVVEGLGLIHGIKMNRSALSISHLLFADDLMIFYGANRQEVAVIGEILSKYSRSFGQMVGYGKFENTNPGSG